MAEQNRVCARRADGMRTCVLLTGQDLVAGAPICLAHFQFGAEHCKCLGVESAKSYVELNRCAVGMPSVMECRAGLAD